MSDERSRRSWIRSSRGYAQADIPPGFENPRDRLPDAPLSRRGRVIYYSAVGAVLLAGILLIWAAATK